MRPTEALIQTGNFELHAQDESDFFIDTDALSPPSVRAAAAWLVEEFLPPFSEVVGIPRGGLPLAIALQEHARESGCLLIADDVLTTGASMREWRAKLWDQAGSRGIHGAVLFARGPYPEWITPLFTLTGVPRIRSPEHLGLGGEDD